MPENAHPEPSNLDDDLASFTDKLLRGEHGDTSSLPQAGDEAAELQAAVRWLSQTIHTSQPDAAMRERIRRSLRNEWKAAMVEVQPRTQPWWKRWLGVGAARRPEQWRSARRTRQSYGLLLAGAAIVLLLLLVSTDFVGFSGTAAAGGSVTVALLGVGLALIIVAGVWLALRRK